MAIYRATMERLAEEMEVGLCDICGEEWRSGHVRGLAWVCWKCEPGEGDST